MSWGHRVHIRARCLAIPFVTHFSPAAARNTTSQTLWVEILDEYGNCGYGEGSPCEAVSGESVDSGLKFIAACTPHWQTTISDMASLHGWVAENHTLIDANPAAWCAIELAFLDLFGKQTETTVESLLDPSPLCGEFRFSAVFVDSDSEQFERKLVVYLQSGFERF